jgi:uncharacterized membrane-anchored protein YhcB (DUF1043 family)
VESIDPVWLFGGIALLAGALLGVLAHRLLSPRADDVDKLKAELLQSREEMTTYKASVNSHFSKTSDLVNELTQDYVKVYRHLAEGAQALSETREFTQVLDQPRGQILISVESEADEAAPSVGASATADSPQVSPADTPQAHDPCATAATVDASDVLQAEAPQVDELSAAEVAAPSDYARGGEDDEVATQSVDPDTESSDDTGKATDQGPDQDGDQDSDKRKDVEDAEPAVTAEEAPAADSLSTPAPAVAKPAR